MRIRAFGAIAIFVVAAMVGVYAAAVNHKPQWPTMMPTAALALLVMPAALGVLRRRRRDRGDSAG